MPTQAFPNGLALDWRGNHSVADSALGRVWRISAAANSATVFAEDPKLTPTGEEFLPGVPFPGANGIGVRAGHVYVSNTARRTLLRLDGTARQFPWSRWFGRGF